MSRSADSTVRPLREVMSEAGVSFSCSASLSETLISSVTEDSRQAGPGTLFVAVSGAGCDGHTYISQAVDAGTPAIILSDDSRADARVPCLRVDAPCQALARVSAALAGLTAPPGARRLSLIGVTGTNGKSTTCHLIRHILTHTGRPTALLGTICYNLIGRALAAPYTTPPAAQLAGYLAEARTAGAGHAVMEVSSHALDQERVSGLDFDVTVFTNLTGDHLDYHGSTEAYGSTKKRLFDNQPGHGAAVLNADDPWATRMVEDCPARVTTFGIENHADVRASEIACHIHGSRFTMEAHGHSLAVDLPLIGRHNIANALAAGAVALNLGVDIGAVCTALADVGPIPGRLQRAEPPGHPFSVFVDYAHTDDALVNVLSALRPLTSGSLWCIFGCGGDRDRSKRPRMAAAVKEFADRIVVTSDNPRTEDPQRIIKDIRRGFDVEPSTLCVEPDRTRAIRLALEQASAQDVILIAGKGHENYQLIGTRRLHFDDAEVVQQYFQEGASSPSGAS